MKKVSILIAARNESANIVACLTSVAALSYPTSHLQVLVGDDASDDNTATLIKNFIKDKPQFELISIVSTLPQLKGKTNVLAQLAHHATGDYLFFTDADIEVPVGWIENMLVHFEPNVGVVTGITTMTKGEILGLMQGLEWLYYLSMIRLFSLFGIPITAMGNNMAVSREAYEAVGKYEGITFSITEDYALFHAILTKGFHFAQLFDARVLTISRPIATFSQLLSQRKRWMFGAMSLPWQQRLGVYINASLLPFLIVMGFCFPKTTFLLAFLHYLLVVAWMVGLINWLQLPALMIGVPIFWFYHIFMNFVMFINFYTRQSTVWKGREY